MYIVSKPSAFDRCLRIEQITLLMTEICDKTRQRLLLKNNVTKEYEGFVSYACILFSCIIVVQQIHLYINYTE